MFIFLAGVSLDNACAGRALSLQELSKVLSISTEDAFAGSFQVDTLVHEKLTVSA